MCSAWWCWDLCYELTPLLTVFLCHVLGWHRPFKWKQDISQCPCCLVPVQGRFNRMLVSWFIDGTDLLLGLGWCTYLTIFRCQFLTISILQILQFGIVIYCNLFAFLPLGEVKSLNHTPLETLYHDLYFWNNAHHMEVSVSEFYFCSIIPILHLK